MVVFNVVEIIPGAPMFNYYFNLVCLFGLITLPIVLVIKVITRS